jgi:hypothetical protein
MICRRFHLILVSRFNPVSAGVTFPQGFGHGGVLAFRGEALQESQALITFWTSLVMTPAHVVGQMSTGDVILTHSG